MLSNAMFRRRLSSCIGGTIALQRPLSTATVGKVKTNTCGKTENVFRLTMSSPPLNSLGLELIASLKDSFSQAANDPRCEGIILASDQRAFSAGLNLKELQDATPEYLDKFWTEFQGRRN